MKVEHETVENTGQSRLTHDLSVITAIAAVVFPFLQMHDDKLAQTQSDTNAKEANRLQREAIDAEQRRVSLEAKQRRAPRLVVQRCCNQVPVAIMSGATSSGRKVVFRIPTDSVSTDEGADDDLKARQDHWFVAGIVNVGAGVALEAKAYWIVEYVVLSNGTRKIVADDEVNGHVRPWLSPTNILPNKTSELRHIPLFLEVDGNMDVTRVVGTLRIVCKDSENETYEFQEPFTLETKYRERICRGNVGPRLSLHFENVRSPHARHVTANPSVSNTQ